MFIAVSCATPTQPTGGPPDTSGPEIVDTNPASGTVNFTNDRIKIEFSDFVERSTFQNAFGIEPDLEIGYSLNWGRRSVQVIFDHDLPDNTTIIFTIGTELTDTRRNRMGAPYQLALSTGPEIDTGKIRAVVLDAESGLPKSGARVFLYREPYDLSERANYSVETDSEGLASFNYLREGGYHGFWVDDRNRNRIWEQNREAAQPFSVETVQLESGGEASFGTVFVTTTDTIAPQLRAVGLLSSVRMRLRFSENIQLQDNAKLEVFDTDGGLYSQAIPLYIDEAEPNILFAQSTTPFMEDDNYSIELMGITDSSGNEAYPAIDVFPGSGVEDVTLISLIDFLSANGVYENQPMVFQYSRLIEDDDAIIDSLKVIQGETLHENWSQVRVENNNLLIYPDDIWQPGESYEVRVWNPATASHENIDPVIWHERDLGEIEIIIESQIDDDAIHRYSLQDSNGKIIQTGSFHDTVTVTQLPPQNYLLIVFEDIDGSSTWNPGNVEPYRSPEPYFIQREIPVQSNMTGQVFVNMDYQ